MKEVHERIAHIGLAITEQHEFVLADAYALSAKRFADHPSMDMDLFTKDLLSPDNFTQAVNERTQAYERNGVEAKARTRGDPFVNLDVREPATGEPSKPQRRWDSRKFPPARLNIGPALNEGNAVASKRAVLLSQRQIRTFIDTLVQSDRFSPENTPALANTREPLPIDRAMLTQRFELLSDPSHTDTYDPARSAHHGLDNAAHAAIVDRFARWAAEINPARNTTPSSWERAGISSESSSTRAWHRKGLI
jgi:hypothetical protein